jgi:hypothetical protein
MPLRLSRHGATWPRYRGAVRESFLVFLFFTAAAAFATWPLAIHPLGGFYGFGNDNWGGIPYFGWLHDAYLGPGDPSFDPEFQAPFGLEIPEHAMQPMDRLFSLLFGGYAQGLGTYNVQIVSSFVLAGCTMYLAARYITSSKLAALVAGFAFTFSPFHLALAMQYNALASIQWIPLYLLALIVLLRRGRKRDAVLTGAAFALVTLTSYYYAWFVGWFTALVVVYFTVATAVRHRREDRRIRSEAWRFARLALSRAALAGVVAVALAAPFLLVSARGAAEAGSGAIEHPITEAVRYSARPWMLFLPPHDNPIVGDRVRPWITQHLFESPIYEQAIYLGYTALILAVVAIWPARRFGFQVGDLARFARGLLVAGAAAGLLIMVGPYIPLDWGYGYWRQWQDPDATARIPSLGWLMYELGPVFRFFTRAFVLVSACLALLAAIGFARLERLARMTPLRSAVLCASAIGLIALEYTNAPPHVWYSARKPEWVDAVRQLPAGSTVIDYPLAAAFTPRSLYYMFWQTKHRRRTLNPPVDPESLALAADVGAVDDPAAGAALRRAGIDYAVVHTRLPPPTTPPYQPALSDDSMPVAAGRLNPWLQPVARTPDAVIYRVLAKPKSISGVAVQPTAGFGGSEPEGAAGARWLERPSGRLSLFVVGKKRPLRLFLTASSFVQPRRVAVRLDGHLVGLFEVPSGVYVTRPFALGTPAAGRHTIELVAEPGPQSIAAATGSGDTRSVSIRLREPVVIRPAAR